MSYSLGFSQAVAVVLFVADKIRQGMFDFVPTRLVSEQLGIAAPSAVKILQALNRAGIIETREGAKGGVRLASEASSITVLSIFNAIESDRPLFRSDLSFQVAGSKPNRATAEIQEVLINAENAMKKSLDNMTIESLLKRINR